MTEKQLERRDKLANEHGDKFCRERNELWWMRTSDYKTGYTAAHNDCAGIIEKLEKALEFYGNKDNHVIRPANKPDTPVIQDMGGGARKALAELKAWRES